MADIPPVPPHPSAKSSAAPDEDQQLANLKVRLASLQQGPADDEPSLNASAADGHLQAREAWEVILEFIVPIAIGAALGWWLDGQLALKPWLTVIFVLLGLGAGFMNMFRRAQGYGYAVGFSRKNREIPADSQPDQAAANRTDDDHQTG